MTLKHPSTAVSFALLSFGVFTINVCAQDEGKAPSVVTTLTGRYVAESGIGDGAKVTSARGGLGLLVPVATWGDFQLKQGISYERQQFDFTGFDHFLPGASDPLKGANHVQLSPSLSYKWSDDLFFRTGFSAEYSGADSARFGDSILFGGYVAGNYKVSDDLSVGAGFGVSERLARTMRYLPFAGVDWRISDQWRLSSLNGPNIRLSYLWTTQFTIFAQGEFEYRDIRLKDKSSIPSGVVRYRAFPVSLGFDWKITDQLSTTLFGGATVAQQYEFARQDGGTLRKSDEKAAAFGGLSMQYRF